MAEPINGPMKSDAELIETRLSSEMVHPGRVIQVSIDQVRLPDGNSATREKVHHPGGVVILPLLDAETLILVRQYRYAPQKLLWELPAGKLDAGEEPAVCAARELAEETGYEAAHLEACGSILTAPGFCNERLWFFVASGLEKLDVQPIEEDEFIDVVAMSAAELHRRIQSHEIEDAKTIAFFYKVFGSRLI